VGGRREAAAALGGRTEGEAPAKRRRAARVSQRRWRRPTSSVAPKGSERHRAPAVGPAPRRRSQVALAGVELVVEVRRALSLFIVLRLRAFVPCVQACCLGEHRRPIRGLPPCPPGVWAVRRRVACRNGGTGLGAAVDRSGGHGCVWRVDISVVATAINRPCAGRGCVVGSADSPLWMHLHCIRINFAPQRLAYICRRFCD
jgi:hypothetical protein